MAIPKVFANFDPVTVERIDSRIPIPWRLEDAHWLVFSNLFHRLEEAERRLTELEQRAVEWDS